MLRISKTNIALSISVTSLVNDLSTGILTGCMDVPKLLARAFIGSGMCGAVTLPIFIAEGDVDVELALLGETSLPALESAGVIVKSWGVSGSMVLPKLRTSTNINALTGVSADMTIPMLGVDGVVGITEVLVGSSELPCLVMSAKLLSSTTERILEYADERNLSS